MRNENKNTTEYTPQWDTGTYQTGSTKPRNEHRGLIAFLMIMVTFLGGIASALGIVNIRLLQALTQEKEPEEKVSVYVETDETGISAKDAQLSVAPSLPSRNSVELELEEPQLPAVPANSQQILEQSTPTVAAIYIDSMDGEPDACGVIIDEAGFLITNAYSLSKDTAIFVQLSDGRRYRATLVGTDTFTDLAVLYIDAQNLTTAQFASADSLEEGDFLACICAHWDVFEGHAGLISDYAIGNQTVDLLHMDLDAVSGPIYNANGQIVGFCAPSLQGHGEAMAIPSAIVKDVVEQIIHKGSILGRPWLGVELEEVLPVHQNYWQLPSGLRVTRIPTECAQLSGLLPGDILVSLNGMPIFDRFSLCSVLRTLQAGDTVTAVVVRDNQEITLELTIQLVGDSE